MYFWDECTILSVALPKLFRMDSGGVLSPTGFFKHLGPQVRRSSSEILTLALSYRLTLATCRTMVLPARFFIYSHRYNIGALPQLKLICRGWTSCLVYSCYRNEHRRWLKPLVFNHYKVTCFGCSSNLTILVAYMQLMQLKTWALIFAEIKKWLSVHF